MVFPRSSAEADTAVSLLPHLGELSDTAEQLILLVEAVNSAHIEGHHSSVRDLSLAIAGAKPDADTAAALHVYEVLQQIRRDPESGVSENLVLADHKMIMEGESFAGRFRTQSDGEVYISQGNSPTPVFIPPQGDAVADMFHDWCADANRSGIPVIPHIAISHLRFETIHPFIDGNGRVGRAIMQRQLLREGYGLLPLSAALCAMRERYYDSFNAYRSQDSEYYMSVWSAAFLAVARQITERPDVVKPVLEAWRYLTQSHTPQKSNLNKALTWISQNPAFTIPSLAEAIAVSEKTSRRITQELVAHKMVATSQKTAGLSDGSRPIPIWEAEQIYQSAEQIQHGIAHHIAQLAPAQYYAPDLSSPTSADAKQQVSEKLKEAISQAERAPHPIMVLPTAGEYSYGYSLFEFFIIKDSQVAVRLPRDNCSLASTGDGELVDLLVLVKYGADGAYYETDYGSKVFKDNDAKQFMGAAGSRFGEGFDIKRNWEVLWSEFEKLIYLHHLWFAIGRWGKYPGPTVISISAANHIDFIGKVVGQPLFTLLHSFLQPQEIHMKTPEGIDPKFISSVSPSLLSFVSKMKGHPSKDILFSKAQSHKLDELEANLTKYKNPGKLWNPIGRKAVKVLKEKGMIDGTLSQSELHDLLLEIISETDDSSRLLAEYLRSRRNPVSHDSEMDYRADTLVTSYGYENGVEIRTAEAVGIIFEVLQQIHTDVFALDDQTLIERRTDVEHEAAYNAKQIHKALHESDIAHSVAARLESHQQFRSISDEGRSQHECSPPPYVQFQDTPPLESQPIATHCVQCQGLIHALTFDELEDVQISIRGEPGTMTEKPNRFNMWEGVYGHTQMEIEIPPEELPEVWRNSLEPCKEFEMTVLLKQELLWRGSCEATLWLHGYSGDSLNDLSDITLHCKTTDLFALPSASYNNIIRSYKA